MKKLALFAALIMLASMALATSRGLPFNHDCRQETANLDVRTAMKIVAAKDPAVQKVYADQFGDSDWNEEIGNLDVVGKQSLKRGQEYWNTSEDRKGRPFQHMSTAKGGEQVFTIKSRVTMKTTLVKRSCLNVVGTKLKTMPCLREVVEETTSVSQAVDLDVRIDIQLSATATAQTGAITINIVNQQPAQQYMVAGNNAPTIFVTSDRQQLAWGGVCWVTPTKIVNNNSNFQKQSQEQQQKQKQNQDQAMTQTQSTAIAIDEGGGSDTGCVDP